MVATVGFIPFLEGSFECRCCFSADPVLRQMRPLAEAGQQITHEEHPSRGLSGQIIRRDAASE
jgi:hypothetical protein